MQDASTNGPGYLSTHSYSASPTIEASKKIGSHSPSPSLSIGSGKDGRLFDPSVREITDIPDDYLSQSQVTIL